MSSHLSAPPANRTKRIAPPAYEALAEALAVIFWNKGPFERFVRGELHDHPELLAKIDFSLTKRIVAGAVAVMLQSDARYQQTAIQIMVDIADMQRFTNLASQPDADRLLTDANRAVSDLRVLTAKYRRNIDEQQLLDARLRADSLRTASEHQFVKHLASLRDEFTDMHTSTNPHVRGKQFEGVLYRLFEFHDLQPRLAYDIAHEQIDGSFTFDTDTFLLEAKWWNAPIERDAADIFSRKIERKGRNTLGLFVAVNGFTSGFTSMEHTNGAPFITIDGGDLLHVLDSRISLEDILRRKVRYLNDTGRNYLPITAILS